MNDIFQPRSKLSYLQRLQLDLITATMHNLQPEIAAITIKIETYKSKQRESRRARNAKAGA